MLTLSAGRAYIKSTLDEDVPNLSAIKGDSAPFVPETTFTASAEYEQLLVEDYMGFAWFNLQYTGDRATEFNLNGPNYKKWTLIQLPIFLSVLGFKTMKCLCLQTTYLMTMV
jgi:hypothetical protein